MRLASLVNGTDLAQWADRREAQSSLPRLLRRLIHATVERVGFSALPADEGVQLGGWDGQVEVTIGNAYVPDGKSVWELGTNSSVKSKADDDYEKRTKNPLGIDPKETEYIFVTPRRWGGKEKWIASKKNEGLWRNVRAYDGDDLAAWLEAAPGVHIWLSTLLGKHPEEVEGVEYFWEEWSTVTRPVTSAELVILDRGNQVGKVYQWLRGAASTRAIRAENAKAAIAFFAAALSKLTPEEREFYTSRCIVVESIAAWRQLLASETPLILIPTFADLTTVASATTKGHHVLLPLGNNDHPSDNTIDLPRPHRDAVKDALSSLKIPTSQIDNLATLGRRSLNALRRKLAVDPTILTPRWSQPTEARSLLAAVLVNRWDDTNEADKQVLAQLSGQDYTQFSGTLGRWANESDPPIRQVGNIWMLISEEEAWSLLSRFLTRDDLQRFEAVAIETLSELDPQYQLPVEERVIAGLRGNVLRYSAQLREGLTATIGRMAAYSDTQRFLDSTPGQTWADRIVRQVFFASADWQLWASLNWLLPRLAEASPEIFLNHVESGLTGEKPVLMSLFTDNKENQDTFWMSPLHTGLLWALETLAWSPEYVARTSLLLATLGRLDPGGRWGNRPAGSLRSIFLSWYPATSASAEQRLHVLDLIRRNESHVAWSLLIRLLPSRHDNSTPTSTPLWRSWGDAPTQAISLTDFRTAALEVTRRLLEDVGTNGRRWADLIGHLDIFSKDQFDETLLQLLKIPRQDIIEANETLIWEAIRRILSRHTKYPDANWAMDNERLEALTSLYNSFIPGDMITRYAWLFASRPSIIMSKGMDSHNYSVVLQALRSEAMQALFTTGGLSQLLEFVLQVERAAEAGYALGKGNSFTNCEEDTFLSRTLGAINPYHRDLALGYLQGRAFTEGQQWLETKAVSNLITTGTPQQRIDIHLCMPFNEQTWNRVDLMDEISKHLYWSQVSVWGHGELKGTDHGRVISNFVKVERFDMAVHYLSLYSSKSDNNISTLVIVDVLQRAIEKSKIDAFAWDNLIYELIDLLDILAASAETNLLALAELEWFFLPLLSYQRTPKVLYQALATESVFFSSVLQQLYRQKDDKDDALMTRRSDHASLLYQFLSSWNIPPGVQEDGTLSIDTLKIWTQEARDLARANELLGIADSQIGRVLAFTPIGSDGAWPHEAVRDLIEDIKSTDMERGIIIGTLQKRGVVTRAIGGNGNEERSMSNVYREYAHKVRDEWPRVAGVLSQIARDYEEQARDVDVTGEFEQDTWR